MIFRAARDRLNHLHIALFDRPAGYKKIQPVSWLAIAIVSLMINTYVPKISL